MSEELPAPELSRFPALTAEHLEVVDGLPLARIYQSGGRHPGSWYRPRSFGPMVSARFDPHPEPPGSHPDRAVMYLGVGVPNRLGTAEPAMKVALAEACQHAEVIDTASGAPYLALFVPARPLRLLDLADSSWVRTAGGNAALSSGSRERSRAWARSIFEWYRGALDGVFYQSSVLPSGYCIAKWGEAAIPRHPQLNLPLSHPALRADVVGYASELGYALVE